MAKPRKKKPTNNTDIKRKEITAIINLCCQGVRFLGDCHHAPRAMNIQKLWTHLRGIYHDIGMKNFLRVLYDEKEWALGVICVFMDKNDPERFEVGSATAIIEKSTADEISCCISDVLLKSIQAIQETDKSLTNDRFIYYGYFFEPEISKELHLKVNGLANMFMNIAEITDCKPFMDNLPGLESNEDTIPEAIKNNGIFPKVREINYIEIENNNLTESVNDV